MKLSEFLKLHIDELIDKYDDRDLDDLTKIQKEDLMLLICRIASTLKIIKGLSDEE